MKSFLLGNIIQGALFRLLLRTSRTHNLRVVTEVVFLTNKHETNR